MQTKAKDILVVDDFFIAASVGIRDTNPGTTDKSIVLPDTGLQKATIERHLRQKGACVIIYPVLGGVLRDQSGPAWIVDSDLLLKVKINPERNANTEEGGVGINIYEAIKCVIDALTGQKANAQNRRHPGGEFFKLHRQGITLSQFDEGLWEYNLMFTKEAML